MTAVRAELGLLPVLAAVVLLSIGLLACGGAGRPSGTASRRPHNGHGGQAVAGDTHTATAANAREVDHDGDGPQDVHNDKPAALFDRDDSNERSYGQAAHTVEATAITALVERYYRSVAAKRYASACALLEAGLAGALVGAEGDTTAEGSSSQPASARCASALSSFFEGPTGRSPAQLAEVTVVGVRVSGESGLALLRVRATREPQARAIAVAREGRNWKLAAIFDSGLP